VERASLKNPYGSKSTTAWLRIGLASLLGPVRLNKCSTRKKKTKGHKNKHPVREDGPEGFSQAWRPRGKWGGGGQGGAKARGRLAVLGAAGGNGGEGGHKAVQWGTGPWRTALRTHRGDLTRIEGPRVKAKGTDPLLGEHHYGAQLGGVSGLAIQKGGEKLFFRANKGGQHIFGGRGAINQTKKGTGLKWNQILPAHRPGRPRFAGHIVDTLVKASLPPFQSDTNGE